MNAPGTWTVTRCLMRLRDATPPWVADTSVALAVSAISVAAVAPRDVLGAVVPGPIGYGLAVLAALPLAVRRRYPLAVLCVCALSLTVFYALGNKSSFTQFGTLIATYSFAARTSARYALGVGTAVFAAVSGAASWAGVSGGWPNYVAGAAQLATAVAVGQAVRGRAEHLAERAELAEQRATEHRLRADRAVADERIRIAGELHDVIAHHLSIIAVQSGLAGYVLDSDPATARTALHTVSCATTESLDELRRMLRVLRPTPNDPEAEAYAPQPGLADLPALTERIRASGVAVRLVVSGARDGVPAGQALCAYRVAQEALTNVLKHTDGASALVHVDRSETELTLRVVDTGPAREGSGSGYGHLGMRERARTYGGSVECGPRPGGGFGVLLRLPLPAREPGENADPVDAVNPVASADVTNAAEPAGTPAQRVEQAESVERA